MKKIVKMWKTCSKRALQRDTGVRTYIVYTQKREGANQLKIKTNDVTLENLVSKRYWGQMASALTVNNNNFMFILVIQRSK